MEKLALGVVALVIAGVGLVAGFGVVSWTQSDTEAQQAQEAHVHGPDAHEHAEDGSILGESRFVEPERPDVPDSFEPVVGEDGQVVTSADGTLEAWIDINAAEAVASEWLANGGDPEADPIPDWAGDPHWWFLPPEDHPADPRFWTEFSLSE